MKKNKDLSILFIGNSHTYYNDMPLMVKRRAEEDTLPHCWFLCELCRPEKFGGHSCSGFLSAMK